MNAAQVGRSGVGRSGGFKTRLSLKSQSFAVLKKTATPERHTGFVVTLRASTRVDSGLPQTGELSSAFQSHRRGVYDTSGELRSGRAERPSCPDTLFVGI